MAKPPMICAVTATTKSVGSRFVPAVRYHDELSNLVTVTVGPAAKTEEEALRMAESYARAVNAAAYKALPR
jgi:hypothetical protein